MRATSIALILVVSALSLGPAASALPTPGLFCDASDAALGRVFPEAMESNDYVSYEEAKCGLELLLAENPDRMKLDIVTQSVGWENIAGGRDTFDVFVVRVSDYASLVPVEDKIRIVFQLSIHGNEKGGREGGLRMIEDFVRDIGHVQKYPEIGGYLAYMELLFVFPQPDGWTHEELVYRHNDACYFSATAIVTGECEAGAPGAESQSFVRVNGHGFDVNRQWPTTGWVRERYMPMSQPEAIGLVDYLKKETNIKYASDIHGMLNPADGTAPGIACALGEIPPDVMGFDPTCFGSAVAGSKGHFVLTMLPAGRQDPKEMLANTQLAELVKERLNNDPFFAEWNTLPNSLGGAWGGEYNDWGTVWDTIGYTDSGFTSDWYAQDFGLNAAGVDFELAYNHVTFDNYYPGAAQRMNAYHVETVREIVRAFMDQANQDLELSVDVKGTRTAYLDNPTVLTNAADPIAKGWAAENPLDDAYDTAGRIFTAAPNDFFKDLAGFVRDGDRPGILDALAPATLTRLANYDNLVIGGSAYKTIANDSQARALIVAWVENGGNLVLTDEAMQMLPHFALAGEGDVEAHMGYAGATNFVARDHPLAQGIRGLGRETYEPVPIGLPIDALSSPNWVVAADVFTGAGGEIVGVAGNGQGASPDPDLVNYGTAPYGAGRVSFLGALLPDPVAGDAVLYGVDSYGTTYTGNQLLRNMLGWDVVFAATPVVAEELVGRAAAANVVGTATTGDDASVPGPALGVALLALAALALVRRQRK